MPVVTDVRGLFRRPGQAHRHPSFPRRLDRCFGGGARVGEPGRSEWVRSRRRNLRAWWATVRAAQHAAGTAHPTGFDFV